MFSTRKYSPNNFEQIRQNLAMNYRSEAGYLSLYSDERLLVLMYTTPGDSYTNLQEFFHNRITRDVYLGRYVQYDYSSEYSWCHY